MEVCFNSQINTSESEDEFLGFPENFFEPHLFLKILSFLSLPSTNRYDSYEANLYDYFGYFSCDNSRRIWSLAPTVKIIYQGTNPYFVNYRFVKSLAIENAKGVRFSRISDNLLGFWKDVCLLKHFRLERCSVHIENLSIIPNDRIETLEFLECKILGEPTDSLFPNQLTSLKRLSINNTVGFPDQFFDHQQMKNLEVLKIHNSTIKSGKYLSTLKNLRVFQIVSCENIRDLSFLENFPKMKDLRISNRKLLEGKQITKTVKRLRTLHLIRISFIRDFPTIFHGELNGLENLRLCVEDDEKWEVPFEEEHVPTKTPNLKHLSLDISHHNRIAILTNAFDFTNSPVSYLDYYVGKNVKKKKKQKPDPKFSASNLPELKCLRIRCSDGTHLSTHFSIQNDTIKKMEVIGSDGISHVNSGIAFSAIKQIIKNQAKSLEYLRLHKISRGVSKKSLNCVDCLFCEVPFPRLKELLIESSGIVGKCWVPGTLRFFTKKKFEGRKKMTKLWEKFDTKMMTNLEVLKIIGFGSSLDETMFTIPKSKFFPKLKMLVLNGGIEIKGTNWDPSFFDLHLEVNHCSKFLRDSIPYFLGPGPSGPSGDGLALMLDERSPSEFSKLFPSQILFVRRKEVTDEHENDLYGYVEITNTKEKRSYSFNFWTLSVATFEFSYEKEVITTYDHQPHNESKRSKSCKSDKLPIQILEIKNWNTIDHEAKFCRKFILRTRKSVSEFPRYVSEKVEKVKPPELVDSLRWIMTRIQKSETKVEFTLKPLMSQDTRMAYFFVDRYDPVHKSHISTLCDMIK